MTPITEIFGTHLRDTHEFLSRWERKKVHGSDYDSWTNYNPDLELSKSDTVFFRDLFKAHAILDQPMSEKLLEMFKGEWEIDESGDIYYADGNLNYNLGRINQFKVLNDFATHCRKQNIPLELNENYEV